MAKGPIKTLFKDAVMPQSGRGSDLEGCAYVDSDLEGIPLVIGHKIGDHPMDLFPEIDELD